MLDMGLNREMLQLGKYFLQGKHLSYSSLTKEREGGGIWAMVVLAIDRGSRQQDMETLKVSFSSLKMESQREGRH